MLLCCRIPPRAVISVLGLGSRFRLLCLARVGVLEEVHLEMLKTWRSVEDLAREENHLEDPGSRQARLSLSDS